MLDYIKSLGTLGAIVATILSIIGFSSYVSYRFAQLETFSFNHDRLPGHEEAISSIQALDRSIIRLDTTMIHLTDLIREMKDENKDLQNKFDNQFRDYPNGP